MVDFLTALVVIQPWGSQNTANPVGLSLVTVSNIFIDLSVFYLMAYYGEQYIQANGVNITDISDLNAAMHRRWKNTWDRMKRDCSSYACMRNILMSVDSSQLEGMHDEIARTRHFNNSSDARDSMTYNKYNNNSGNKKTDRKSNFIQSLVLGKSQSSYDNSTVSDNDSNRFVTNSLHQNDNKYDGYDGNEVL